MTERSDDARRTPTILLTGTAGAGKTIVAKEIHELLRRAGSPNAMIDLDAVGRTFPAVDPPFNSRFVVANLRAMWPAYEALALHYLVLARVLLSADELADYRASLPQIDLRVVRLEAPDTLVQQRLEQREPGVSQSFLVGIAAGMAADLASQRLVVSDRLGHVSVDTYTHVTPDSRRLRPPRWLRWSTGKAELRWFVPAVPFQRKGGARVDSIVIVWVVIIVVVVVLVVGSTARARRRTRQRLAGESAHTALLDTEASTAMSQARVGSTEPRAPGPL